MYYALFHCHLVYAIEIWSCASWSNINELYLKQKAAIRIISNSTYNAHTQPLFKKLKILPLNLMVDFFKIKFMQTVIQKTAPISFHDIWQSNREKRLLDNPGYDFSLRDDNDLFVPFARTLICERFPLTNLPKLWNTLSPDLSIIRNPVEFDLKLKEYFSRQLPDIFTCSRLLCPSCHLQI